MPAQGNLTVSSFSQTLKARVGRIASTVAKVLKIISVDCFFWQGNELGKMFRIMRRMRIHMCWTTYSQSFPLGARK